MHQSLLIYFSTERNNDYALSFDGNNSGIYYPTVSGFSDITVCAWIKAALDNRLQCLFSFYNEYQRFQLCFDASRIVIYLVDEYRYVSTGAIIIKMRPLSKDGGEREYDGYE